jgi:hypothetical protein
LHPASEGGGRQREARKENFFESLQRKKSFLPLHPASEEGGRQRKSEERKFLRKLAAKEKLLTFATPNGTTLGKHTREEVVTTTTQLIQMELAYVL